MQYQTVLITGASSGFGKATAELLAKDGYKLILISRRLDLLTKLKRQLKTKIFIAQVDVSDQSQVDQFFKELPDAYQDVDVLINNAGLSRNMAAVPNTDINDWTEMVDTNIKGLLYFTDKVLKILAAKNNGLIINIGSVAGNVPYKGGNVYGATKAFVRQFSRNLRADLAGSNVKISNIEPGMAETEFSLVRFKGDTEKAKNVYANTRPLKAEDIANTIKWVIEQPEHVNIDNIEIMPVDQTYGGMVVNRS